MLKYYVAKDEISTRIYTYMEYEGHDYSDNIKFANAIVVSKSRNKVGQRLCYKMEGKYRRKRLLLIF